MEINRPTEIVNIPSQQIKLLGMSFIFKCLSQYMDEIFLKLKAAEEKASRLYELNLLAFVLNKFDFWSPKCPNYENIEF